jgi:hypothetical protein
VFGDRCTQLSARVPVDFLFVFYGIFFCCRYDTFNLRDRILVVRDYFLNLAGNWGAGVGKQYSELQEKDREFASRQKVFFLASASGEEVNLAPKGEDCLRFLDPRNLLLLDYPGSSNRTGRDLAAGGFLTLMFCSFDDNARVLRIFCSGEVIGKENPEFEAVVKSFAAGDPEIVRQVFRLSVRAVENSCGLSVPVMRFEKKRDGGVRHWAENKAQKARGGG